MDSLLASYGSDDEDEKPVQAPSSLQNKSPAFVREVPPKRSIFSSLPPPTKGSGIQRFNAEIAVGDSASLFRTLPPPHNRLDSEPSASKRAGRLPSSVDEQIKLSNSEPVLASQDPPRSSLFGALPPPKNSSFNLVSSVRHEDHGIERAGPSGTKARVPKKRMVEFKPPVDLSVLDDDEDDKFDSKRPKVKKDVEVRTVGLVLPAPKHTLGTGHVLGGGVLGSGGRRAAMEIGSASLLEHQPSVEIQSTFVPDYHQSLEAGSAAVPNYPQENGDNGQDANICSHTGGEYQDPSQWQSYQQTTEDGNAAMGEGCEAYANGDESNSQYPNWQYDNPGVEGTSQVAVPEPEEDPISKILKMERRRGKAAEALSIVQVKQDDLRANKIREDQLRVTGIAFGPAYKPASTEKAKPSKLHRRKHQIGSLYFDMKSREMELAERRSKGLLTKAQTQAKYGW